MQLFFKKKIVFLFPVFLFFGCASKYRPVNPGQLNYNIKAQKSDVELYYRYDVLQEANNIRHANKELKKKIKLVAVKIYNNTPQQITIGQNAKFFGDDKELILLNTEEIQKVLRQSLPVYLSYLALAPIKFSYQTQGGQKTVDIFAGAITGGALTATNIYVAGKANKKLKEELKQNSIINKDILPGETLYGIIGFKGEGYVSLTLKLAK
ncbi:MAG TPA: hypothetical protein VFN30_01820 [Chitinophagaceae bacterium]|nr:hypothetical protein [Chitinophagaceae bacterium]